MEKVERKRGGQISNFYRFMYSELQNYAIIPLCLSQDWEKCRRDESNQSWLWSCQKVDLLIGVLSSLRARQPKTAHRQAAQRSGANGGLLPGSAVLSSTSSTTSSEARAPIRLRGALLHHRSQQVGRRLTREEKVPRGF